MRDAELASISGKKGLFIVRQLPGHNVAWCGVQSCGPAYLGSFAAACS